MGQRRRRKEARYKEFQDLLDEAVAAGQQAARAVPERAGQQARHGAVRVQLDDGRTSFARFIREEHEGEEDEGMFRRGNRRTRNYLPVGYADYDKALAYAEAVREVLLRGGIGVSIETQYVAGPEDTRT